MKGFPGGSYDKESTCNAGDSGSILGWEDPLEKGTATHSSIPAWRIPWTEEPGRLQCIGSQRGRHEWVTTLSLSRRKIVVQSLSCIQLFLNPWIAACQAFWSFSIPRSLLKFMSIELMMPSNHLVLCCPLLLLLSIFPSIRFFSSELALHIRRPKYWGFSMSPCSEYSGLISFRTDWYDLPAVQRTLKNLLQCFEVKS